MNRNIQTQQQIMENDAAALAAEMFDHFCSATTIRQILGLYRNMCDTIGLRPGPLNEFYSKLKSKIKNWKAQALWKKFDARASHRVYNKGTACNGVRVLVIGAGPCGLRTAIEAQLLGAKVVVVEKRDRISRNNVLHLWPFLITDLRNLGAKKFYGKFCAGAIDHISIRQLQCILLKVALLLGVEIHEGVSFNKTIEPKDGCGWRASISPEDHAVSHYEFDVLIGADGKRNTLEGFRRKEFRGKLAIAITANFINKKTEAEARVEEISGVAFIFNQSFFKELYHTTGIDLENIVYYKDETHYFVMTAKKHSLLDKGVIIQDYADPAELLKPSNVNTERLSDYASEAAGFSTKYQMPNIEFAVNHYGKPDVAMFDFTSMFAAENSSRIVVRKNYRLLQCLVGDSLLEPFWPTGSGCARGFLSSMDAAFAIKLFANNSNSLLAVLAQRESIYRLLAQTTPENLQRDIGAYTLDPSSRYPNLNRSAVTVYQIKNLLDSDDPSLLEQTFIDTNVLPISMEPPIRRKRRTGDSLGTVILRWVKLQLKGHDFSNNLTELNQCFTNGQVLCTLIHRYRPDLIDLTTIKNLNPEECNEQAFKIFENDLGIPRVMTAKESINLELIDTKIWQNYLEQICEVFRGEIPHVKHPKLDFDELKQKPLKSNVADFSRLLKMAVKKPTTTVDPPMQRVHIDHERSRRSRRSTDQNVQASVPNELPRRAKKRRSYDKCQNIEERTKRLEEIEVNRNERQTKRRQQRKRQTENFLKSLHMLQVNTFLRESDSSTPFEDYSLYVYRQSAPMFNDRVKELERKLLYPDRERGISSALSRGGPDDQFSDRIKSMEQRITGRHGNISEKKPKDLLRAIGKIESNDWNVKEIEKKIELSKKTEVGKNREKVPKWSREQFLARQNKMSREGKDGTDEKYREIDYKVKSLDKQLKDPALLERGERGKNKVASIAGHFVKKEDQLPEERNSQKSNSKSGLVFSNQGVSEICHFCKQRVYLMEKLTAEGLVFHRSCLKCNHCHTNLRLGGYSFDRDNIQGLFYCTQHYRLPAKLIKSMPKKILPRLKTNELVDGGRSENLSSTSELSKNRSEGILHFDLLKRGQTPERIEFENADMSDGEPSLDNVIDENEWTDRNFGTGTDSESDISSTTESESDSEIFEEAMGSPLGQQTLQLANDWIGKQRYIQESDEDDFYDTSEDDEIDTQTEGEELAKARELRMQEVKLRPPLLATTTDTETEMMSKDSANIINNKTEFNRAFSNESSDNHINQNIDHLNEKIYNLNNYINLNKEVNTIKKDNLVQTDIMRKLSLKNEWLKTNTSSTESLNKFYSMSNSIESLKQNKGSLENINEKKKINNNNDDKRNDSKQIEKIDVNKTNESCNKNDENLLIMEIINDSENVSKLDSQNVDSTFVENFFDENESLAEKSLNEKLEIQNEVIDIDRLSLDSLDLENVDGSLKMDNSNTKINKPMNDNETNRLNEQIDLNKKHVESPKIKNIVARDLTKFFPNSTVEKKDTSAINKNQKELKDVDLSKYFTASPVLQRRKLSSTGIKNPPLSSCKGTSLDSSKYKEKSFQKPPIGQGKTINGNNQLYGAYGGHLKKEKTKVIPKKNILDGPIVRKSSIEESQTDENKEKLEMSIDDDLDMFDQLLDGAFDSKKFDEIFSVNDDLLNDKQSNKILESNQEVVSTKEIENYNKLIKKSDLKKKSQTPEIDNFDRLMNRAELNINNNLKRHIKSMEKMVLKTETPKILKSKENLTKRKTPTKTSNKKSEVVNLKNSVNITNKQDKLLVKPIKNKCTEKSSAIKIKDIINKTIDELTDVPKIKEETSIKSQAIIPDLIPIVSDNKSNEIINKISEVIEAKNHLTNMDKEIEIENIKEMDVPLNNEIESINNSQIKSNDNKTDIYLNKQLKNELKLLEKPTNFECKIAVKEELTIGVSEVEIIKEHFNIICDIDPVHKMNEIVTSNSDLVKNKIKESEITDQENISDKSQINIEELTNEPEPIFPNKPIAESIEKKLNVFCKVEPVHKMNDIILNDEIVTTDDDFMPKAELIKREIKTNEIITEENVPTKSQFKIEELTNNLDSIFPKKPERRRKSFTTCESPEVPRRTRKQKCTKIQSTQTNQVIKKPQLQLSVSSDETQEDEHLLLSDDKFPIKLTDNNYKNVEKEIEFPQKESNKFLPCNSNLSSFNGEHSQIPKIDMETNNLIEKSKMLHLKKQEFMNKRIVGNNPYLKKMIEREESLMKDNEYNRERSSSSIRNNHNHTNVADNSKTMFSYFKKNPVVQQNPTKETGKDKDSCNIAPSDSDTSSADVGLNSATEISTDSEFDLDPVSKNPPEIFIDETHLKRPTRVQVRHGVIENGYHRRHLLSRQQDKVNKDIHLEFEPLVQVDPSVLFSTNRTPLKNPRPGDYLLKQTASTEGIASKKSLELKKRYLLGESTPSGIMKSGSTSILDSKFKNFHSNISECQKLLNPAPEISPTMQVFLKNTKVGEVNENLKENIYDMMKTNNLETVTQLTKPNKNDYTETVNTTLIENKIKDILPLNNNNNNNNINKEVETINLITPEKSKPIIDLNNINIPNFIIKTNQEFIDNLKNDVIDLTSDLTPVKDRSLEEKNENFTPAAATAETQIKYELLKNKQSSIPDIINCVKDISSSPITSIEVDNKIMIGKNKNAIDSMLRDSEIKKYENLDIDEEQQQRSRSPAHETSINVPTILSWDKKVTTRLNKDNDLESDSLSSSSTSSSASTSSSTSSLDEIPHYILDSATSPETQTVGIITGINNEKRFVPRVEIRNSSGELMQIDSLMIIDGKYIGDPEDLKLMEKLPEGTIILGKDKDDKDDKLVINNNENIIDVNKCDIISSNSNSNCNKTASILKYESSKYNNRRPDLKFDTKNENKIDTLRNLPLIIYENDEINNKKKTIQKPNVLLFSEPAEINIDTDKTPTVANPEPSSSTITGTAPTSCMSDSETEITGQQLTETELSDWTADDAVSENFVDIEFALNSNKGTIKRNKKSKTKRLSSHQQQKENKKDKSVNYHVQPHQQQPVLCGMKNLDFDNIEFMDTGSENDTSCCIETYSTTNKTMLKNRGYVEFVDNHYNYNKDYINYKTDQINNKSPKLMQMQLPPTNNVKTNFDIVETINNDIKKINYIEQGACILNNYEYDYELKTPINEVPKKIFDHKTNNSDQLQTPSDILSISNDIEDDSLVMIASQTTTEDSDALTVVTSPLDLYPNKIRNDDVDILSLRHNSSGQRNNSDNKKHLNKNNSVTELENFLYNTIYNDVEDDIIEGDDDGEIEIEKVKSTDEMSYEEYVRQLQTKIREISTARDSLDMRKAKRKSSKEELSPTTSTLAAVEQQLNYHQHHNQQQQQQQYSSANITPIKSLSVYVTKQLELPTVSSKLEELTKERTKQKDLIHDLVMNKLQTKKQLNAEKRLNRSRNRTSIFNPNSSPFATQILSQDPTIKRGESEPCTNSPHYHPIIPERRNSSSKIKQLLDERRHSVQLPTSNKTVVVSPTSVIYTSLSSPEKYLQIIPPRPLSENYDDQILSSILTDQHQKSKLMKAQSFCVSNTNRHHEKINHFSEFTTPPPIAPPRKKIDELTNTTKIREEARARAKLKTNKDLGLSPEEKILMLRKRYMMNIENFPDTPNKSDDIKYHEKKLMTSKSVNDIRTIKRLNNDENNIDSNNINDKEMNDFISDPNLTQQTEQNLNSNNKKLIININRKDSDRRKSIIQTFSDFFHKKKDNIKEKTMSAIGTTTTSQNDGRFGIFKLPPRSKSKSCFDLGYLGYKDNGENKGRITSTAITSIANAGNYERCKSENCIKDSSSSTTTSPLENITKTNKCDEILPPIPPLPTNYQRSDDESISMTYDNRDLKKIKAVTKATRQAELKRLRIAQEIQREQEEIEVKIKEFEASGVSIEKALRGEGQDIEILEPNVSVGANDERLLKELLEIWRNITQLKKRDEELGIRQQELQLEHRHAQLKEELNNRLSCNKLDKTSTDIAAEGAILNEMLEIVAKRAALRPVDIIDKEKQLVNDDNNDDGDDVDEDNQEEQNLNT